MLFNISALIIVFALSLVFAALFITWYPRKQELIITVLFVIVVVTPFIFSMCSNQITWLPPAITPLNPKKSEHGHPGRFVVLDDPVIHN